MLWNLCFFAWSDLTCCSITTRAIAAWTTLVRSRQSIQLTLKIPSCLQMTPAWSTLKEEDSFITGCIHRITVFNPIIISTTNYSQQVVHYYFLAVVEQGSMLSSISLKMTKCWNDTYQAHFMSVMISEIASVSICTFSNFIPRLRNRI